MSDLRPPCQFDNCEDEDAFAVAVVAMFAPGVDHPYDWVMACRDCTTEALANNGGSQYTLVATAEPAIYREILHRLPTGVEGTEQATKTSGWPGDPR